jgi:hypothetical protein
VRQRLANYAGLGMVLQLKILHHSSSRSRLPGVGFFKNMSFSHRSKAGNQPGAVLKHAHCFAADVWHSPHQH